MATRRFTSLFLLIWALVTILSGVCTSGRLTGPFSPLFHPYWVIGTLLPVVFIHYREIRRLNQGEPSSKERDALLRRYAAVFGLALAFLTGISTMMGFLPAFFHQLIVWPLAVFAIFESVKTLKR